MTSLNNGKLRRARKTWKCWGCKMAIFPGGMYWEDLSETPMYQSGDPYHLDCAIRLAVVDQETIDAARQYRRQEASSDDA